MRHIASAAMAAIMAVCLASGQTAAPKKKSATPARKPAASSRSTASKTGARTTVSRTRTQAPPPRTTWRTRQMAPSAERYKEIQGALVAKGYLQSEEATGSWNASSTDALRRFQSEQNLEASGKINSLSLIALGLGPKRDTTPVKPPAPPAPAQDPAGTGR